MTNTSFGAAQPGPGLEALPLREPTALAHIERLIRLDLCRQGRLADTAWRMYERQRDEGGAAGLGAVAQALDGPPARVLVVAPVSPAGHDAPIGAAVLARLLLQLGHQVTVLTEPGGEPALEVLLQAAIGAEGAPPVGHWGVGEPHAVEELACAHDRVCVVLGYRDRIDAHDGPLQGIRSCAALSGQPTIVVCEAAPGDLRLADEGRMPGTLAVVAGSAATGVYGIAAAAAMLRGDPSLCATAEDEAGLALVAEALEVIGRQAPIGAWEGWSMQPRAAVVALLRSIVERSLGGLRSAPARSR